MDEPRNPFILGHRIMRPYFCDREKEQQTLTSAVINGRNIVMISPRRMGKTSLIHLSLHDSKEIEESYLTFFFDILQTNSLSEFTYLLGKGVFDRLKSRSNSRLRGFTAALKSLKGQFGFDPVTGSPTFNIQLGDITHPEYTLDEIFSYLERTESPVIMVIDEFQQVTKYPEKNTEALLRTHMQQMSNTTFIFAGSQLTLLREMFVSSKRPFYNSAEIMHLGPIEEDIYVDFSKSMFAARERSIDEEPVRKVFNLFEGNTFYMQRTMNGAFGDTRRGCHCDMATVIRAVRSMLAANEVIYREILSTITISQKATLIAIARERTVASPTAAAFIRKHSLTSASSVQNAIQKLIRSGHVTKTDAGYSLTDPLFRVFINEVYATSEIDRL